MLFSKNKEKDGKPKKRSILGLLFNPEIGMELKPLGESVARFVRMLAIIFAMNGLFPKDHPAIKDENIRLTLRDVFGTAWSGLRFTREGLPQILLFFGVVLTLITAALFIFVLILSLFSGSAQAADPGIFDEPAGRNDFGVSWIDYLFHGEKIEQGGINPTQDCALQEALSKALGFFSSAVLIFAGIMLLYHLMSMIIKTAQTGKPFEGANQVWAPIRLVFAIALLVPVNVSATDGGVCNITGYNSGQYLVMRVAKWGSSLGSNGWAFFLDSLNKATEANCGVAGERDSPSCVPDIKGTSELVETLIIYDACAKLVNYYDHKMNKVTTYLGYVTDITGTDSAEGSHYFGYKEYKAVGLAKAHPLINLASYLVPGFYGSEMKDSYRMCGGYEVPSKPQGSYGAVYTAQIGVFNDLRSKINTFNSDFIDLATEKENAANYKTQALQFKVRHKKLIEDFQKTLNGEISKSLKEAKKAAKKKIGDDLESESFVNYGWVMAGTWFNTIARLQANKFQAVHNSLPVPVRPGMLLYSLLSKADKEGVAAKGLELKGVLLSTKGALVNYEGVLKVSHDYLTKEEPTSAVAEGGLSQPSKDFWDHLMKDWNLVELTFGWLNDLGGWIGLWDSDGTLLIKFGLSQNPIAELTAFGQKNITAGSYILSAAGGVSLLGTSILGNNIESAAKFVVSILVSIASVFYLIGFTLGFIVPLYPFYRFFFGSLVWIMSVFEAVVLVPLFALAHINPGGDGLPGPKAAYGYQVGMQILLRPILMIFGLIAGFFLFKIMLSFLNFAFVIVAEGTGAFSGQNMMVAKLVYSVLYGAIVLLLANQCFKPIGMFPQVALLWLGYSKPQEEPIDTKELTVAAAYLSSKAVSVLPKMGHGPGDIVKGLKGDKKAVQNEKASNAAAATDQSFKDMHARRLGSTPTKNPDGSTDYS